MIVKLQPRGHSFKGSVGYIAHDKDGAETAERVTFFDTVNMLTKDPEKAAKVMAWTDAHAEELKASQGISTAGAKPTAGATLHGMISWEKNEDPSEQHQRNTTLAMLEKIGLQEHEITYAGHNDTNNIHVHFVVNLTHPIDGTRNELKYSKRKAQEFALEYEQEHGLHCEQRLENAQARQQEGAIDYYQTQKERHGVMVNRAYVCSDNGASFKSALEAEGLTLANGRKTFVAVDDQGQILNLSRLIDGHKTKDIKAKLSDLDRSDFENADNLSETRKAALEVFDKETDEIKRQNSLEEAAHKFAQEAKERPLSEIVEPYKAGSLVQSIERGNYGTIEAVTDNLRYEVLFTNKKTGKSFAKEFGHDEIKLIKDADKIKEDEARFERIQKDIDQKTAESRKKWEIGELTDKRDSAANYVFENSGFWARLTGRTAQGENDLRAAQSTLDERSQRFRADIESFNEKRPLELKRQELEKHGFYESESYWNDLHQQRKQQQRELNELREYNARMLELEQERETLAANLARTGSGVAVSSALENEPEQEQEKEQDIKAAREKDLRQQYEDAADRQDMENEQADIHNARLNKLQNDLNALANDTSETAYEQRENIALEMQQIYDEQDRQAEQQEQDNDISY